MRQTTIHLLTSLPFIIFLSSCETNNTPRNKSVPHQKTETSNYMNGQNIATETQMTLGKNLMNAINAGGTEYAIEFCSTKAIHLTDSVAISLNTSIKRVSDKNRNPENAPSEEEMSYILTAKETLSNGKAPTAHIRTIGGREIGYYPIITNGMCLQCHGQPNTEISEETLSKINTLYPNDLATGYKPNELRGIWVVELDKNN